MSEPVRSTRNARVVAASRLHRARERRAWGCTLVEGPNVVADAITGGAEFMEIFVEVGDDTGISLARRTGITPTVVERRVLQRLSGTETPRGPVAVIRTPTAGPVERDAVVIDVSDPGNAGTIVRTAAAFGLDVVASGDATDLWSPKALRAGAGAHFHTCVGSQAPDSTIATVVAGGEPPWQLSDVLDPERTWGLLVGSEAHGLDSAAIATADVRVTIPMPGETESLNAAVAAGIVMYEMARWRASTQY